jgi:hypothetical protein
MPTVEEKLEALFAKVRLLPEQRQAAAVDALTDIAEEPYQLSADELAVLEPALQRARQGEFASDEEISRLLDKPWR